MSAPTRYDTIGIGYADLRCPDPRVAALIHGALGDAARVVNVGCGTGSYEPADRRVVGVEPSRTMIDQRPVGAAPVVQGVAEHLPFGDDEFDAALAILTVHHWPDHDAGLQELARVARRQVVVTWDPHAYASYWLLTDYLPEIAAHEATLATVDAIRAGLSGSRVEPLPVPADCTDGFGAAYWCRPEAYLDPLVRRSISGFAACDPAVVERAMARLAEDLDSGRWHDRHSDLLALDELDVGYRLVVADPT